MCAAALFIVSAMLVVRAQTPKTVTDYFMIFPSSDYAKNLQGEELKTDAEIAAFRKSIIKIEDIRNGYLRLEGGWEGWGEFALFKKADGTYLIANTVVECAPVCSGTLAFHEYKDGKWNDVSSNVFPAPDNDEVTAAMKRAKLDDDSVFMLYTLPRKGTEITAVCSLCRNDADFTLFRYSWKPPKFVRK